MGREAAEFLAGIIAEEMVRRGPVGAYADVLKPGSKLPDPPGELRVLGGLEALAHKLHSAGLSLMLITRTRLPSCAMRETDAGSTSNRSSLSMGMPRQLP